MRSNKHNADDVKHDVIPYSPLVFGQTGLSRLYTGTVAQLVGCPLCDREVAGSIPSQVIPKTLKMVPAALSLGTQH